MTSYNSKVEELQKIYDSGTNNLVLLYGRRGLSKHQMMKGFLSDKPSIVYLARDCSNDVQREFFADTVEKSCDIKVVSRNYCDLFNHLRTTESKKLVLYVDHADYMMKKDPEFFENILKLRAKEFYKGPVMIILMTESICFAENELVEEYEKEYKKFDEIIKVPELNFLEVVRMYPGLSEQQAVEAYGILGGVTEYFDYWDKDASLKENVCRLILDKNAPLHNMAREYLEIELRELGVYQTILYAIASGKEKLNDLFEYTGYSRPKISVYIKNLAKFDAVSKVESFETGGYENAKKGVYRVNDTFLNFYYKLIFPNLSFLEVMGSSDFYDYFIEPYIPEFLDRTFIKICMEFLELSSSVRRLPITIKKMGTWVGKKANIDIIARDEDRNTITAKCCYSKDVFNYEMYEELMKAAKEAKVHSDFTYLFSVKGFDAKLKHLAIADKSVVLVDMNEM